MKKQMISKVGILLLLGHSMVISAAEKKIYGVYEKVRLMDINGIVVKAKLDTGALTTSLGATKIKKIKKEGEEWVRFKPQIQGEDLPVVELPLVRTSKIKRRLADILDDDEKTHTRRPVVEIKFCVGGEIYPVEVNLTDRSHFNYPLLIGVSALRQFNVIIDPSLKFQSEPDCN